MCLNKYMCKPGFSVTSADKFGNPSNFDTMNSLRRAPVGFQSSPEYNGEDTICATVSNAVMAWLLAKAQ